MKIEKPTKSEYEKLRDLYSKQKVVTELDLKDMISKEKIEWFKKYKYIPLLKELEKCMMCGKPIRHNCTTCSYQHGSLWDRIRASIKTKSKEVSVFTEAERPLIKYALKRLKKEKSIELKMRLRNELV